MEYNTKFVLIFKIKLEASHQEISNLRVHYSFSLSEIRVTLVEMLDTQCYYASTLYFIPH